MQRYCTASSSGRQPNFAAMNRYIHLYSAGRPSRWALAHVSSLYCIQCFCECWLGVRKSIEPVKNWLIRCWHGYLSAVRCKWFAYGSADVTATLSFLDLLKSKFNLPGAGLPRLSIVIPKSTASYSSCFSTHLMSLHLHQFHHHFTTYTYDIWWCHYEHGVQFVFENPSWSIVSTRFLQ